MTNVIYNYVYLGLTMAASIFHRQNGGKLIGGRRSGRRSKKRKRLVKTNDKRPPRTRSAAAPANPDPEVAIKERLDNMFGSDDDSDATPENGNGENPNKGETSGDEVAQWAEDDGEETED